jgi:transmembrane sensor
MQINVSKNSAEDLIHGYLKGELNDTDTEELINWIKANPVNKKYFDECCEIWVTGKVSLKNPGYNYHEGFWKFKHRISTVAKSADHSDKRHIFRVITKYAAIIIISFSLSGLLFYQLGKTKVNYPLETISELCVPMGSHAHFSLSDGTTVDLNAGSILKYDNRFGLNERVVQLEGEGYFKVAKDLQKPFIVKTSCLNIRALGTEFNVKAYSVDNKIEATLVEGSIKVEPVSSMYKTEVVILKPNQKLTFYKSDSTHVESPEISEGKIESKPQPISEKKIDVIPRLVRENVNVEHIISWKENRWIFEKESLSQIAVELERKFDVEIKFDSERLKNYRFTGTIVAEPIEQVLEVMSISAPIRYKLEGRVVTLSENRNFKEIKKNLYNN